jgi:cysteine desulfurase
MSKQRIYLDNAASTPIDPQVLDAMLPYLTEFYGNPSSIYAEGRKSRMAIEHARKTIAEGLSASVSEIFFTSGGTESNNMVLKNAVRDLGVKRIISAPTEHHCVLHTLERLEKEGVELILLPVDQTGRPAIETLDSLLAQSQVKTLVSLMHGNNEIGTMIPLEQVGDICKKHGALLHSDTVQTVSHHKIDLSQGLIHFLSGSAHKFHGPKGVGFVYINNDCIIEPFIDGGAQERNMRGGTENLASIVGMAKAFDIALEYQESRNMYLKDLKLYMAEQLQAHIPGIAFNGEPFGYSMDHVLSVSFEPNSKTELLVFNLDIEGISASAGSACSSGVEKASHVLAAISPDSERPSVRFSFSHLTSRAEIDECVSRLERLVR